MASGRSRPGTLAVCLVRSYRLAYSRYLQLSPIMSNEEIDELRQMSLSCGWVWENTLGGVAPQSLINEDIVTCDYFMLLLWDRWGSIPNIAGAGPYSSACKEEFSLALECLGIQRSRCVRWSFSLRQLLLNRWLTQGHNSGKCSILGAKLRLRSSIFLLPLMRFLCFGSIYVAILPDGFNTMKRGRARKLCDRHGGYHTA